MRFFRFDCEIECIRKMYTLFEKSHNKSFKLSLNDCNPIVWLRVLLTFEDPLMIYVQCSVLISRQEETYLLLKKEVWIESKSGKFLQKTELDPRFRYKHYEQWQQLASDFRTIFREFLIEKFAQSEFAVVQFTQRQVAFLSTIFIQ